MPKSTKRPGMLDVNGKPIPKYIVHGGPELADIKGLDHSMCQYIMDPPSSEEHRRNREAMFKRWEAAGAIHVYRES
jgi:RNase adaptor protein for sRNA GlmZ degradation